MHLQCRSCCSAHGVWKIDRLRLSRDSLLQRAQSIPLRVSRMVSRRSCLSSSCVFLRCQSFGTDARDSVPASKRNCRDESNVNASASGQHVLHDEATDPIGWVDSLAFCLIFLYILYLLVWRNLNVEDINDLIFKFSSSGSLLFIFDVWVIFSPLFFIFQ